MKRCFWDCWRRWQRCLEKSAPHATLKSSRSHPLQHEVAAVNLVEIGAVEFLSQLRQSCKPALHPFIDAILELLLRVPDSFLHPSPQAASNSDHQTMQQTPAEKEHHSAGLVSSEPVAEGSSVTISREAVLYSSSHYSPSPTIPPVSVSTNHLVSLHGCPRSIPQQTVTSSDITSVTSNCITPTIPNLKAGNSVHPLLLSYHNPQCPGGPVLQTASTSSADGSAFSVKGEGVVGGSMVRRGGGGGEKRIFPWFRLSVNDLHILKATERYMYVCVTNMTETRALSLPPSLVTSRHETVSKAHVNSYKTFFSTTFLRRFSFNDRL